MLEDGIAAGTPLAEILPLSEVVLELEITSNRPDCLAVYGVAREVHAVTAPPLAPLDESDPPAEGPGRVEDHAAVEVQDPDLCPRYMARVLTDVRVGPSPAWLRAPPRGGRDAADLERRRHHQLRRCCSPGSRCTPSTSTASRGGGWSRAGPATASAS